MTTALQIEQQSGASGGLDIARSSPPFEYDP
jgi:hypothetical protein